MTDEYTPIRSLLGTESNTPRSAFHPPPPSTSPSASYTSVPCPSHMIPATPPPLFTPCSPLPPCPYSLQSLYDEIQARSVQEMRYGLIHAFLDLFEYEKLTGGKWGTLGNRRFAAGGNMEEDRGPPLERSESRTSRPSTTSPGASTLTKKAQSRRMYTLIAEPRIPSILEVVNTPRNEQPGESFRQGVAGVVRGYGLITVRGDGESGHYV
jgi:hypothetical protein